MILKLNTVYSIHIMDDYFVKLKLIRINKGKEYTYDWINLKSNKLIGNRQQDIDYWIKKNIITKL